MHRTKQLTTGLPSSITSSPVSRMWIVVTVAVGLLVLGPAVERARAVDFNGTVDFQGDVTFAAPIAGIATEDLDVSVDLDTEATGNGEKCSILTTSSDSPDVTGNYPDAGSVDADMLLERGGPQLPDGDCIVTIRATGSDGVSVSARGSETVFVSATEIDTAATVVVPTITVRESKAVSGVDKDCQKWVKKQLKLHAKCNFLLLRKGPEAADKCKDEGPEPPACDPGDNVEAILALAHGVNDQQTDAGNAEGVDNDVLGDQVKCQKRFGKAAAVFSAKRIKLVDKKCVQTGLDTEDCRSDQTRDSKSKLDQIAKCAADQDTDGGTGRIVPDVGDPCSTCIDGGGAIDTKCLRSCFELAIAELSDGIIGDVPVCGNGIVQPGEFCDDGNLVNGDGCSSLCEVEPPPAP